ncbi:MAG: signal peptide peptidase SppA [Chloroflexi bacterium]|nr:signal peptide peptidase SppA [Chloroflexota bacterium]
MWFLSTGGRIAVVELHGVIGNAVRPAVYNPLFYTMRRTRRIRALVLDINSPGGEAAASHDLYASVARVAEAKPVVAYIRGTGASGAYYVSCAASKIMALPTALVGSIGVLSVRPVLETLLNRLGVAITVNKGGRLKDMSAFWRQPTPEEDQKMQALVDGIYNTFVQMVAKGRKLEEAKVRELATGEVFLAQQARELGLVDEIGDMEAALDMAASMAGIPRRVIHIRPRRPFMRRILGGMAEDLSRAMVEEMELRLRGQVLLMGPPGRP